MPQAAAQSCDGGSEYRAPHFDSRQRMISSGKPGNEATPDVRTVWARDYTWPSLVPEHVGDSPRAPLGRGTVSDHKYHGYMLWLIYIPPDWSSVPTLPFRRHVYGVHRLSSRLGRCDLASSRRASIGVYRRPHRATPRLRITTAAPLSQSPPFDFHRAYR